MASQDFLTEAAFLTGDGLTETTNLDNLDFNLEALFACITLVFAARSRALKSPGKDFTSGFFLNAATASLKVRLTRALKTVFRLSCLTFFIACFITGISLKFLLSNF